MELLHEVDPSLPPSCGCCSVLSPFSFSFFSFSKICCYSSSSFLWQEPPLRQLLVLSLHLLENRQLLLFSSLALASNYCKFSSPSTPSNVVAAASALFVLLFDNHRRHCCCCKCTSPSPSLANRFDWNLGLRSALQNLSCYGLVPASSWSSHQMESVVTQEPPASASMPEARIVCRVCQKQFARYTCPRCNSRHCSLQCYKGHSARCTESFMRENVMEEMRHIQPEDETKRKMLDILKRFHSEEELEYEDEDDFTLSQETIQKFLSGNNLQFEDLSAEEMKQFQRVLASGKLSKMIEPWEPWWLKPSARTISLGQDGTLLVRPVDECDFKTSSQDIPESNLFGIPAGPDTPLPPLSKLSSTDPSPLLGVHLVDVLYSHCFTLRLYNGDWNCDPLGAAMVILNISSVLGKGGQPETIAETLSKCIEETCSPIYRHAGGFRFALGLIDDVIILLSLSTNALICLLCDTRRLILASLKMLKTEKPGKAKRDESRSKLKSADRKLYFLMCWVREQPRQAWSFTQSMVSAEKASLSKVEQELKNSKTEARGEPTSSVLIEEL